ncbi:MAG: hypothetical protein JWM40_2965 [Frankiales bacterium]|nr:hypothetical protein [Frankiales bacterium]
MRLLAWLLQKLDDNLHIDIPQQRDPAPEEAVVRRLPPVHRFEIGGYWSHCRCCRRYSQDPCPLIHLRPCGDPSCGDLA